MRLLLWTALLFGAALLPAEPVAGQTPGRSKPQAPNPIAQIRAQIRQALVQEEPERALELLKPWLIRAPEDASFHALHGEAFYALEQHEKAVEAFANAVKFDPTYKGKLFHYGRSLIALERGEAALEIFEAMIGSSEKFLQVRGHFGAGLAWQSLGDDAKALTSYESALQLEPKFLRATYRVALLEVAEGKDAAAIEKFDRVLANDPLHHGAAYNRALALGRVDRTDDSEKAWERYREVLEGKQKITLLRTRLRNNPQDFDAMIDLGSIHAHLGAHRKAVEWFSRAAQLAPFDPRPALGTVAGLRALGKGRDAENLCAMLLRRQPPIEELRAPLIEMLEERGATEELKIWRPETPEETKNPAGGSQ